MRLIDADELLKIIDTWDWQELYLPVYFKEMAIDKAQTVEPEPVYFPPCVDCQNRSKEILTAYNNMKQMQTYNKIEVITILEDLKAEIEGLKPPKSYEQEHTNAYMGAIAMREKDIAVINQKIEKLRGLKNDRK